MKTMKFFRKKSRVARSVCLALSLSLMFSMMAPVSIMAYWVYRDVFVEGGTATITVWIPGTGGTNGYYQTQTVTVVPHWTTQRYWVEDSNPLIQRPETTILRNIGFSFPVLEFRWKWG